MSNKFSEEDIIAFIHEMFSTTIAREQLLNPTKEFVVSIYALFLREFGIENVGQPDIIATSGMDNIERYETNIIVSNLYKSVAYLVVNAGVPDMAVADIVSPKKIRTNRILSALCKLYIHLSTIEQKWNQLQQKCIDLPVRRQAVEQRSRELKRQIEDKSMYLSSNKSKSQGLAQELKKLAEIYEQKRTAADLLAEQTRSLKTIILNKRDKLSEIDVDLSQLKEELQELSQRIVKSPERIRGDNKEKESELQSKRNEKKKLEKKYMELIRSVDHLKEASKCLMPSLERFTEAFKDIECLRKECEKMSENKVLVNSRAEELKSFKVQIKEQEKSCNTLRQQIVNNEKQFQQQIQTMKQINGGMKKDLDLKTKNQSDAQKQCLEERLRLETKLDALDVKNRQFNEMFDQMTKEQSIRIQTIQKLIERRMNEIKQNNTKTKN